MKQHAYLPSRLKWPRLTIIGRLCPYAIMACLAGCAAPALYDWGDYGDSLELCYEKENTRQAEQILQEQIVAYATGKRIPPGVYADYGFLLFRRGDTGGALAYFEKEKNRYPESALLMDKLIERIKKKNSPEPPQTATSPGGETP